MRIATMAFLLLVGASAACSRKVVVTTPAPSTSVSLKVTNDATQAITVVVESGGTELTVGSVSANTTAVLELKNLSGSTVKLRATLADGSKVYSRDGVVLTGIVEWRVP